MDPKEATRAGRAKKSRVENTDETNRRAMLADAGEVHYTSKPDELRSWKNRKTGR